MTNPFVGPRPIERKDPSDGKDVKVYGRDTEIRELKWLFTAERIVWLHGPSGAGKTSLVQAGLIPALEQDNFRVLPTIRLSGLANSPGNRYINNMRASLGAPPTLRDFLAPPSSAAPACRVLIFDQFEELISLDPADTPAKINFCRRLGKLLALPHFWALFIVREDYLSAFSNLAGFLPTGMNHRFRLDLLSPRNAGIAINSIAASSKVREFLPSACVELAARLAKTRDARSGEWKPGLTVEPVLLQVVCRTFWASLPADVTKIAIKNLPDEKTFDEVLQVFYADCLKTLDKSTTGERTLRDWIEDNLLIGDVRNVVLESAIPPQEDSVVTLDLLDRLVETRLLRHGSETHKWYELAHDRLIEPVRAGNRTWKEQHLNWFEKRAAVWKVKEKAQQFLLSDAELVEAESWIQQTSPTLTPIEAEFLRASRDAGHSRAERRFWIRTAWIFAVGLAIALGLALLFRFQAETRELITRSRHIPRKHETAAYAADIALQSLDKSMWLDEGLRRDAIETLNEALQRRAPFHSSGSSARLLSIAYTPKRLAIATEEKFTLYEIPSPLPSKHKSRSSWSLTAFPGEEEPCRINTAVLAANGESADVGLSDGTVHRLDLTQTAGAIQCEKSGDPVQVIARSSTGAVAAARRSRSLEIDGRKVAHTGTIRTLAFHPGGNRLAIGTEQGTVEIVTDSGATVQSLKLAHPQPITALAWTSGGLIAGSDAGGTFRHWDPSLVRFWDFTHTPVNGQGIAAAAISPDGSHVATAGDTDDRLAIVWPATGAGAPFVFQSPPEDEGKLVSVAFFDDTRLLVATDKGDVRLYHLTPATLRQAANCTLKKSLCPDSQ